ncbi:MAG: hypothetical protein AB8H47_07770 [Bacteroidia bacterium]
MNFVSKKAQFPLLIFFIALISTSIGLSGCSDSSPDEGETKLEQSSETVQASAQDLITEKLTQYYGDLSNGQISAVDYYAPSVERFFNSENIPRTQIDRSLKTSIEQNPGRKLRLIPASVKTQEQGGAYIAEIAGIATKVDASGALISKDTFRNLIRFNEQIEIISYESMPAAAQTRKLGVRYGEKETLINDLLLALKTGKLNAVTEGVHPDLGAYFIYKTGLFPAVERISALSDLNNILSGDLAFSKMQTEASSSEIPAFDCDTEFAKQGCFYQKLNEPFKGLSETMEFANQAEKRIDESVLAQQEKIEQLVSYQVVDTKTGISLFLGESDGRWYVFVIDLALYDCSA